MRPWLPIAAAVLALVPAAAAAPAADSEPPRVKALPSTGRAGQPVRLRVWANEPGTSVRFAASIFRGTKHLFVIRTGFIGTIPLRNLRWYFVEWTRPTPRRGTYRFCVKGFDAAGNASGISCSSVSVQ